MSLGSARHEVSRPRHGAGPVTRRTPRADRVPLAQWVEAEVERVRILRIDRELKPGTRIEEHQASIVFDLARGVPLQVITGRVGVINDTAVRLVYPYGNIREQGMKA